MAISILESTRFEQSVSSTAHSTTLSLSAGASRKVVVIAVTDYACGTVSGCTWDGNAMTERASDTHSGGSNTRVYAYTYDIPDGTGTGSKTITFTVQNTGTDVTLYAWHLANAATGAPEHASATEASSSVTDISIASISVSAGAMLLAGMCSSSPTPTYSWTGVTEWTPEANETNYTSGAGSDIQTAGSKTVTASGSGTAGLKVMAVLSIAETAVSGLSITSVTPSSFDDGITGIVIAGSGFGASQGSSTVDIGGQAQTVTAWSDTSITITSARGSNSMGSAQLKVTIR